MNENASVYSDGAITVLLCGVGGQGTILAADLLAKTAMANGMQVKLSEIHGMAQRGGAVTTVVRIGEKVNSMVCCQGSADYLLSFETTEALREIAEAKDKDSLDYMLETLEGYTLPEAKATVLLELQAAAKEENWERIQMLVE